MALGLPASEIVAMDYQCCVFLMMVGEISQEVVRRP